MKDKKKKKPNPFRFGCFLLILAMIFGAVLAIVDPFNSMK